MANKRNSGHNGAVIALLILALVMSVGVAVMRFKSHNAVSAVEAAKAPAIGTRLVEPADKVLPDWTPEQNPFTKPSGLRVYEDDSEPKLSIARSVSVERKFSFRRRPSVIPVLPAPVFYGYVGASRVAPQTDQVASLVSNTSALPEAVLMAMIKGPNGRIGVIKLGGASAQTVGEGDTLADGFKVKYLAEDHAVLTNGRDEIIAKRPRI